MTEHSTEELKRQYYAARVAADEACERWYAVLIRDKLFEFAAVGGVVGVTRVRKRARPGIADMSCGPYVVTGAEGAYGVARYVLAKINKSGTPSKVPRGITSEHVFIIAEDQRK